MLIVNYGDQHFSTLRDIHVLFTVNANNLYNLYLYGKFLKLVMVTDIPHTLLCFYIREVVYVQEQVTPTPTVCSY